LASHYRRSSSATNSLSRAAADNDAKKALQRALV